MEATCSPSVARRSLELASPPSLCLLACSLLLPKQLVGCWSLAPTIILDPHTRALGPASCQVAGVPSQSL